MEENKYYVYLHIKETNGEPFYVGKGKENRYKDTRRSEHWNNIFNKYGFDVIFLETNLNEKDAFEKEIYWIKRIGRKDLKKGPLVNYSDGGEGQTGKIMSDETKEKLRQINLGKKLSKESIEKTRQANIGSKRSDIGKQNISKSLIGKKKSEEARKNMSIAQQNKAPISEETREKMKQSFKGLNAGRKYINKDNVNKFVKQEQLDYYINLGWKIGRIINKNGN
jgi:hypothetical protein